MLCTTTNQVWKHWHDNPLTHSEAHYLMTVHEHGQAKAGDLVKALEISAPTASQALKTLVKKGWLAEDAHKVFTLTENATAITEQIVKNKALMMDFFVNFLGVDKATADADSCKIEHLLSPETSTALEAWLHDQRQVKKGGGLPVVQL